MTHLKYMKFSLSIAVTSMLALGCANAQTVDDVKVPAPTANANSKPGSKIVVVKSARKLMRMLEKSTFMILIDEHGDQVFLTAKGQPSPEPCSMSEDSTSIRKCAAYGNRLYFSDLQTSSILTMHGSPIIKSFQDDDNNWVEVCRENKRRHTHDKSGWAPKHRKIECPNPIH